MTNFMRGLLLLPISDSHLELRLESCLTCIITAKEPLPPGTIFLGLKYKSKAFENEEIYPCQKHNKGTEVIFSFHSPCLDEQQSLKAQSLASLANEFLIMWVLGKGFNIKCSTQFINYV